MPILYNPYKKKGVFMIPAGGLGPSVSADFSYSKSSYHQDEANPTPTITGTPGGAFICTSGAVFVDTGSTSSSTGQIDLDASTIDTHLISYTVDGVTATANVGITASPFLANTYSMEFDSASSQYIDASSLNSTIQTQTSGAISLWIYPTVISGTKYFIGYSNSSTTVDFFNIGTFTSGKLRLLFRNDASGTAWPTNGVDLRSNASVISTNNWYHICVVSDGSAYTVYLNGSAITMNVDAGSNSGKWFGDFSGVTMNNLYIGASSNSGGVNLPFDGKIDEVAIWNTALSSDAVTEIYNATANNTGKALDLTQDSGNYNASSNLQYFNRLGD